MPQRVAEQLGWDPVDKLQRLEGFKDPWEFAVCKGTAVKLNASLRDNGIMTDAVITTVRRVLIPEAWKVGRHSRDSQLTGALAKGADGDDSLIPLQADCVSSDVPKGACKGMSECLLTTSGKVLY